jgi:hypothetical protein
MRAAMQAMVAAAGVLRADGDSLALTDRIASWSTRQNLVRLPHFDALDAHYGEAVA